MDTGVWTASKVRETFVEFYKANGHTFVPSSSTVPHDDPSLLFANAGMNQFKPIFQGTVDPASDFAKLARACNSQKCIRAGGKHNDLDDVGKDVYHHTFFEMLGNWSFGDYFKKEAIGLSWKLLTEVFGLDPERLYVSYFEGSAKDGLPVDSEARQYWLDLGVPESRVLPFGSKENFWEMGETGPCGPCSEIHYDRIGGRDAAALVNMDDPDVLEIWNLVFIQFNREGDGTLRPLPHKHIDTGMGLERLVSVLQDRRSNYDTDVFTPIFGAIEQLTGARAYAGRVGADDTDGVDMAYRVVADHVRTLTFAIADGGVPSNEGRGYVLRRILRRGARYARRKFGVELGAFFARLVDTVVAQMGDVFPEIARNVDLIKEILCEEEVSFARTLDRGERLFEQTVAKMAAGSAEIPGASVWRLYDTYGFPVDLTRIMAEEAGLRVDEAEFEREQARARALSKQRRNQGQAGGGVALDVHAIAHLNGQGVAKTDDAPKYSERSVAARVLAVFDGRAFADGEARSIATNPDDAPVVGVVLDRTNFYAEQGGQEYDTGALVADDGEFTVEDVQVYGGYVLHTGFLKYGALRVGDAVTAQYDELRRRPIRANHTATHVLNFALRKVLRSDEADQRGSLVAPDRLRFDFAYKAAVSTDEVRAVEEICRQAIRDDLRVYAREVPLGEARQIAGLRAVFGEVYPDPVRVVSIGADVDAVLKAPQDARWTGYSIEFCGGTHVASTAELKHFVVTEESSIARGIRRVVAVTGEEALKAQLLQRSLAAEVQALQRLQGAPLDAELKRVGKELEGAAIGVYEKAQLRAEVDAARRAFAEADKAAKAQLLKQTTDLVQAEIEQHPERDAFVFRLPAAAIGKAMAQAATHVKNLQTKAAYFIAASDDSGGEGGGRVAHQCVVPKALVARGLSAGAWAAAVAAVVGGKSGGKDESAQGSGTDVARVDEAVRVAEEHAKAALSC
ncbi:Alanine--tRNA ligase [Coemansia javaensis]|uniref:Alanine--tRNA ligase n=1 Tax=Coemansia javaensis TaxID=2761396 RepID=A0A9W8HGZ7_9FUNG|nr:Alanine--tRNA ligase [Coemansia javaensis]